MKTATVRAMINPKKKEKVSKILARLGMSHSEAINIYYSLIEEYKGLPFDIKLPEKDSPSETISPEVVTFLKESIKNNYRLGELLAK